MSQQQKNQQGPAFYNRKFFPDAVFWKGTVDASQRAFFMQLPLPLAELDCKSPPGPVFEPAPQSVIELYENTETEGPKPPPVNGAMLYGGGAGEELWLKREVLAFTDEVRWPTTDITRRKLIIMPLKNGIEFMAFGVCTLNDKPRFVFAARGTIGEQLKSFSARLEPTVSTVERLKYEDEAPLEDYLVTYLSEIKDDLPQLS